MRRMNRALTVGVLSVPMALGVSGVAMAGQDDHGVNARAQGQAEVEDQEFNEEDDGVLNAGLLRVDDDENEENGQGGRSPVGEQGDEVLLDASGLFDF